jgi:succinate dehydrogenase / fumarate reductase membrane anchor subunit
MVRNVTSLSRSGLSDFVIQRVTAIVLLVYTLCVVGWLLSRPDADYAAFVAYFGHPAMQVFSTLAVLSIAAHAWIGMWTVATDYIREHYFGRHNTAIRITFQFACLAALFVYVLWGLAIIWRL